MRLIGLDVGEKRIGVALSDEEGRMAFPLEVIVRKSRSADLRRIAELVERHEVERVVVGLPVMLTGQEGPQARTVQTFVARLQKELPVPVVVWDERLSTAEVERLLIDADVGRGRRRRVVDKLAAAVILDSYLRGQKSALNP